MAGRSSQADNRGTDFFGFLASGKGRQYHTYRDAPGAVFSGLAATGGVVSDYNDGGSIYRAHIFTSSGQFSVTELGDYGSTVEFLLVAGGGAGGDNISSQHGGNGGGGGGGLVEGNALPVTPTTTFTITIGAGGADSVKSATSKNSTVEP